MFIFTTKQFTLENIDDTPARKTGPSQGIPGDGHRETDLDHEAKTQVCDTEQD